MVLICCLTFLLTLTSQVVRDLLTPCCDPEYTSTCGGQIWGCLRSEIVLFVLQVRACVCVCVCVCATRVRVRVRVCVIRVCVCVLGR